MLAPSRVEATPEALNWIARLKAVHGPLMFYQSGGCCEGSAPLCFRDKEYWVGGEDVFLGEIGGCPFYIRANQFEYWRHTQLIIDVVEGAGARLFARGAGGRQFSHAQPRFQRRGSRGAGGGRRARSRRLGADRAKAEQEASSRPENALNRAP